MLAGSRTVLIAGPGDAHIIGGDPGSVPEAGVLAKEEHPDGAVFGAGPALREARLDCSGTIDAHEGLVELGKQQAFRRVVGDGGAVDADRVGQGDQEGPATLGLAGQDVATGTPGIQVAGAFNRPQVYGRSLFGSFRP